MPTYRVRNWQRYQHYKQRCPPCKVHRDILQSKKFMSLAPASKALLMLLWVVASENSKGEVNGDLEDIRFRLRWPELTEPDVTLLVERGFLLLSTADASKPLAPASKMLDRGETEERQSRGRAEAGLTTVAAGSKPSEPDSPGQIIAALSAKTAMPAADTAARLSVHLCPGSR